MANATWWTDEKVNSVVKAEYVTGKLGAKNHFRIHTPLAFGDGLTDDTYLDWILARGKRLFLILDDIGCPDNIFNAVDKSLDDDDLPLSDAAIWDLDLAHGKNTGLDKKFHRRQFFYLIQELGPGRHVDYSIEDVIPVKPVSKTKGILSSPDIDKVYVGTQVFTRRRIPLGGDYGVDRIHFIMYYKGLQKLKHPHLVSVWATYTQGEYAYVLLGPNSDVSLKSFLEDPPKTFKALTKQQKRDTLLKWIHCISDAVAYLHDNGFAHQAIRPSNIFIDEEMNIFLGEYAAMDALDAEEEVYQKEAYEHQPPEKWKRKTVPQETAPLRSTLNGGGRTNRRIRDPNKEIKNSIPRRNPSNSGSIFNRRPSAATSTMSHPSESPDQSRVTSYAPTVSTGPMYLSTAPTSPMASSHPHSSNLGQSPTSPSPHLSSFPNIPSRNGSIPEGLASPIGSFPSAPSRLGTYPPPPIPSNHPNASSQQGSGPVPPGSRHGSIAPTVHTTSSKSSDSTAPRQKRVLVTTFTQDSIPVPYPSDVFSLSTIMTHLLSALFSIASDSHSASKFSPSALRSHLGKNNRNAGRGGAPADASFHVNLNQVATWLEKLEKEAGKRGDGHFFAACAIIVLVRGGLHEKWEDRWKARDGEREVRRILEQWVPGGFGTCCAIDAWENERGAAKFGLGLTGSGVVEIGERKSDGSIYMPSPPYTDSPGASRSGSISGSGSGSGSREHGRRYSIEEEGIAEEHHDDFGDELVIEGLPIDGIEDLELEEMHGSSTSLSGWNGQAPGQWNGQGFAKGNFQASPSPTQQSWQHQAPAHVRNKQQWGGQTVPALFHGSPQPPPNQSLPQIPSQSQSPMGTLYNQQNGFNLEDRAPPPLPPVPHSTKPIVGPAQSRAYHSPIPIQPQNYQVTNPYQGYPQKYQQPPPPPPSQHILSSSQMQHQFLGYHAQTTGQPQHYLNHHQSISPSESCSQVGYSAQPNWPMQQQPYYTHPSNPSMHSSHSNDTVDPLKIQLEEMKRELERLKGEVGQQRRGSETGSGGSTVGSGGKPKKEEKVKPGRRGGGYGKQAVPKEVLKSSAQVGKGVGDDLVRGFFKRSAQKA